MQRTPSITTQGWEQKPLTHRSFTPAPPRNNRCTRSTTSPEDRLTFHLEVFRRDLERFTSSVLINDYIMTGKRKFQMHIDCLFIYEYIFCRCFPHKIIDVDSVSVLFFFLSFFFLFFCCCCCARDRFRSGKRLLKILGLLYHFSSRTQNLSHVCRRVTDPRGLCGSGPGSNSICIRLFSSTLSTGSFEQQMCSSYQTATFITFLFLWLNLKLGIRTDSLTHDLHVLHLQTVLTFWKGCYYFAK